MNLQRNLREKLIELPKEERALALENSIERYARKILALGPEIEVDQNASFADLGFDSVTAYHLAERISEAFGDGYELAPTKVFEHPSIHKLSQFIGNDLNIEGF